MTLKTAWEGLELKYKIIALWMFLWMLSPQSPCWNPFISRLLTVLSWGLAMGLLTWFLRYRKAKAKMNSLILRDVLVFGLLIGFWTFALLNMTSIFCLSEETTLIMQIQAILQADLWIFIPWLVLTLIADFGTFMTNKLFGPSK